MKRFIANTFLFSFLFANTAFLQLLSLPTLVHHFYEHVELDDTSFIEFIKEHYIKEIKHPDDIHHDHQKLPFKTEHCNVNQILSITPNQYFSVLVPKEVEFVSTFYSLKNYSNAYLNSIWQPPRLS